MHLGVTMVCLAVVILLPFSIQNDAYSTMWLLPAVFLACYWLYLGRCLRVAPYLFRIMFVGGCFLRYVVLPVLMVLTGHYGGQSVCMPTVDQVQLAVILMVYELMVCTLALFLFDAGSGALSRDRAGGSVPALTGGVRAVLLPRRYFIYGCFFLLTAALLALQPQALSYFTFIMPRETGLGMDFSRTSVLLEAAIMCALVSKQLLFVLLLAWCKRKHEKDGQGRYVLLAIGCVVLNICLYYGKNRSGVMYIIITSVITYMILFPRHRRSLILPALAVGAVIITYMTDARHYYDYFQDAAGIPKTLLQWQHNITQYFGGIHNVAVGIETASVYSQNRSLVNLLYDMVRPIVGLNLLVKGLPMEYSNTYYNYCYFMRTDHISVLLPTVAQGFFYFGALGAPLVPVLLMAIATRIEKAFLGAFRVEYVYFLTLSLLRLGTLMGANLNQQINDLSIQIMVPVILIWLNDRILLTRKNA